MTHIGLGYTQGTVLRIKVHSTQHLTFLLQQSTKKFLKPQNIIVIVGF